MTRTRLKHWTTTNRLGGAVLVLALSTTLLSAQENGGQLLSFGFSQRLEANDNLALDAVTDGRTIRSETALSFLYRTETRRDQLSLDGFVTLRAVDGPGDADTGLADPRLGFSYTRTGANATFSAEATLRQSDIAFLRPLEDFIDDEGFLVLPTDLEDLSGEGTRLDRTLSFRLSMGNEGPFGVTLTAAATELSYRNTTSADLIDSTRFDAGANLRLRLSPVLTATVALNGSVTEESGAEQRETRSISASLTNERPDGDLSFGLTLSDGDNGDRQSLRVSRDFELPRGNLAFVLGATRNEGENVDVTGNLSYRLDLPDGRLTLGFERAVASDSDGGDTLRTALSLGLDRELNALYSFSLDAAYVRSEEETIGTRLDTASLNLGLNRVITPDWSASLGYRYEARNERGGSDPAGRASDNSVYLTIGRSFDWRP